MHFNKKNLHCNTAAKRIELWPLTRLMQVQDLSALHVLWHQKAHLANSSSSCKCPEKSHFTSVNAGVVMSVSSMTECMALKDAIKNKADGWRKIRKHV